MNLATKKILICASALSICFAAQAFLQVDDQAPASPAKLEQLTQLLATCPELSTNVANTLDANNGVLSQHVANQLIAENKRCRDYQAQLPTAARYRLAYASLRNLVSVNVSPLERQDALAKGPALQLSMHISSQR